MIVFFCNARQGQLAPVWICPPWRIGTLKYLEIKIEEWPSGAKRGQTGANGAKWCQIGLNGAKRSQAGPKKALRGQTWQKGPNGAKWGQMGLIFACTHIYMRLKKHVFQPRPSNKNCKLLHARLSSFVV